MSKRSKSKRVQKCCCCEYVETPTFKNPRLDDYEPVLELMNPNVDQLRSVPPSNPRPSVSPVPVPVASHESVKSIADKILSKPAIVQRSEQLVLPTFTDNGELRSNGFRSSLLPDVPDELPSDTGLPPAPPPQPPTSRVQYTPDYSPSSSIGSVCINAQTAAAVAAGQRHDPAGVTWISQAQWDVAIWDGTPFNPCGKTPLEIFNFVWPNPYGPNIKAMRGLRQLYDQLQPFADVYAPTVAEIDYWNTEVLRHFRRVLGLSEANYPLSNDKTMFYRAHWSAERQWTDIWDSRYPADASKPYYGPCVNSPYLHCGYGFTPDCVDQTPYLMNGDPCVTDPGSVEGAFTALMDQPWSVKFAVLLGNTVKGEGIGGHVTALLRKSKIGFNWTCQPPIVQVRIIMGGTDGVELCTTPPLPTLTQYTPRFAPGGQTGADCMDYQTSVTNSFFQSGTGAQLRHDPDGIYWIAPSMWVTAQWDGVTTWDPTVLTAAQVSAGIFPDVNTMRGLRELFYAKAPFADNQNPTVPEIDNWNIEVLKHFRRLLGRSVSDPIDNDKSLYYQAHWASERYKTTVWDSRYPYDAGKPGTWGPCVKPGPGDNPHCGASFIPSCADQVPYYLDPVQTCVGDTSFAEGIFSVNTNLPWSIKFARTIAITLLTDGLGGHTAPFLGTRSKIGLSWMCGPTTSSLRVKWG